MRRFPIRRSLCAVLAWELLTAGSCATTGAPEPKVIIQKVEIPVAVNCVADVGPDPAYADTPDAIIAAADIFERAKLLLAGRDQRDARLAERKASVAGCH